MNNEILNQFFNQYPELFDTLIQDHTTKKNIFWATDNYQELGERYHFSSPITFDLISGVNEKLVLPRFEKTEELQELRVREMAEVFTPSWVCNAQNNLIDDIWFGKEHVFNEEVETNKIKHWKTNPDKITFPDGKSWKNYIKDIRLEMTCGEAPYITSRHDTTTGYFIPITDRIGLLDRKLRVIHENVDESGEWLEAVQIAYKSIYAFEWQGDSLFLARKSMMMTFIENYVYKFNKNPLLKSMQYIAYIISWNVWQMDGIKGVLPSSCSTSTAEIEDLFGGSETNNEICKGCETEDIYKHNGIYCLIKDWNKNKKVRFIDLPS